METIEQIDDFIESIYQNKDAVPYLYNAKRTAFQKGKDWVYYSGPFWDIQEVKAAIKAFLCGQWVVSGEYVAKFERAFSRKIGSKSSLMVNSGSSANLILITALKKHFNWNDADDIIVSPVGFPTTIAPLLQCNLRPNFVDIEFDTLNFDVSVIEKAITQKTRAIFLSPVLGNPMDIDRILEIAERRKILVLLDGCDSLGSKWRDRNLSEYAYASSCSFYPAHHISTGEGGMVSSNDEEFINLARSFAWWGRACYCVGKTNLSMTGTCGERFSKWIDGYDGEMDHKYLFTNVGYNLKPLDMQGAIGLEQLGKLDAIHSKRRSVKQKIDGILTKYLKDKISLPKELAHSEASWFGVPIICNARETKTALIRFLEENKIQTRHYFAGNILRHPAYAHLDDSSRFPHANEVLDRVFFIGCHPSYSPEMLDYIEEVVKQFSRS